MSAPGLIARARAPRPHGREAVWQALRAADRPLTFGALWHAVNHGQRGVETHPDTIRDYLRALVRAGIVARSGRPRAYLYCLVRDLGPEPPRVRRDGTIIGTPGRPDGRTRMWQAIRVLGDFDATMLAATAQVSEETAREYARMLAHAGYLVVARRAERVPGGRRQAWAVVPAMWSGPRAPRIIRRQGRRLLWDPNLSRIVWPKEAGDE